MQYAYTKTRENFAFSFTFFFLENLIQNAASGVSVLSIVTDQEIVLSVRCSENYFLTSYILSYSYIQKISNNIRNIKKIACIAIAVKYLILR